MEVVFLFDVLDNGALLQAGPVAHRLARVLSQAHPLEPAHEVAAEEAVHHPALPAPAASNPKKRSFQGRRTQSATRQNQSVHALEPQTRWSWLSSETIYHLFLTMSSQHWALWYLMNWAQVSRTSSGKSVESGTSCFFPYTRLLNLSVVSKDKI